MNFKTDVLFKRGIGNKILQWSCKIVPFDQPLLNGEGLKYINCRLQYETGELNGSKTTTFSDKIEGKNIGKKNETTSYTQAVKERKSLYDRKRKQGYKSISDLKIECDSLEYIYSKLDRVLPQYNTDADNCIKPMKAQKFEIGKMKYPAIQQPKINGVRATIRLINEPSGDIFTPDKRVEIKSKEGLIYNVKHIEDTFLEVYNYTECFDVVFDGELYIYGQPVTSIGGAARNPKNPLHKSLQFVCFDLAIPDFNNIERDELRNKIFTEANGKIPVSMDHNMYDDLITIKICRDKSVEEHSVTRWFIINSLISEIVNSDEEVLEFRDKCIKYEYEGSIVRDMNADYQFGSRPKTMRKCKKMDDAEFKILNIRSVGDSDDKVGFTIIFTLQNDLTDETFECNGTGTVEQKLEILNDKSNIGKLATVQFYERTINKLPFHANVIGIRDYE